MHAKNNRQNSNFQIAYFLAGSCHTPDGAYSLLCDLRENRSDALKMAEAAKFRAQAKAVRAKTKLASDDEAERLEGRADFAELEASAETSGKCIEAARAELAFIEKCIGELQPQRKYSHLPDSEAHEAAQAEEWKLELIRRAENYLLTTGGIPPDQFEAMRLHPAFLKDIYPAIEQTRQLLRSECGVTQLLSPQVRYLKVVK